MPIPFTFESTRMVTSQETAAKFPSNHILPENWEDTLDNVSFTQTTCEKDWAAVA